MNLKSPKILDYHVIQSNNIEKFEKEVKEYITEGWECQGGFTAFEEWSKIIIDADERHYSSDYPAYGIEKHLNSYRSLIFYQAMVKYDVG